MDVARISPQEIQQRIQSGETLLVCAYKNEEKFLSNNLTGAISYGAFQKKLASLDKNQEIVFYCA